MHHESAIAQLPDVYATALRLRDKGLGEQDIATRRSVDVEAVGPLLQVAAAKLGALLDTDYQPDEEGAHEFADS